MKKLSYCSMYKAAGLFYRQTASSVPRGTNMPCGNRTQQNALQLHTPFPLG